MPVYICATTIYSEILGEEEDDIDPFEEIKKEEYRHLLVHIVCVHLGSRTGILAIHFTLT